MSEIGEALGTVAEGGLLARAVGGKPGTLTDKAGIPLEKGHFAEGACLNCGTELVGAHCHSCGQAAHLHRTIGAFLHDLMHGALHLDGKTWRTLPMLVARPGELTRRYIDGERMRFVSPMALFLFSVFLMFAAFQAVGLTAPGDLPANDQLGGSIEDARRTVDERVAQAEAEVAALPDRSPRRLEEERQLAELRQTLINAGNTADNADVALSGRGLNFKLTGIEALGEGLIKKWRDNPSLMLYKLQANGYKFSWLLIPLSIPFVWILFAWKRRFGAYDHAIFVTYSIAFMSMLFIALSLLAVAGIGKGWVFAALAFIPPLHIYRQLRGAYELTRFSALWRTVALAAIIVFVVLAVFLLILVLLGTF